MLHLPNNGCLLAVAEIALDNSPAFDRWVVALALSSNLASGGHRLPGLAPPPLPWIVRPGLSLLGSVSGLPVPGFCRIGMGCPHRNGLRVVGPCHAVALAGRAWATLLAVILPTARA